MIVIFVTLLKLSRNFRPSPWISPHPETGPVKVSYLAEAAPKQG